MILIHESMPLEAAHVARIANEVFGIGCDSRDERRDDLFPPISNSGWNGSHAIDVMNQLQAAFRGQAVIALTRRDLYDFAVDRSPDDVWMFGMTRWWQFHSVVSTARLRGFDSNPEPKALVPDDHFRRRLSLLAVHEIGHALTAEAKHHRESAAVNARTNARDELGGHCDDPACVMYPTVDVKAPSPDRGYMEFDGPAERRFDAGLDDQLERLRADWFCGRCLAERRVPNCYRLPGGGA